MTGQAFSLFSTALGVAGVVWGERGVVGIELPNAAERDTRARLARRFPDSAEASPPAAVSDAIDGIVALLAGERRDLTGVALDFDGAPEFNQRVYALARAVPPGKTSTYGDIARQLGEPGAAREVGRALGENPFPMVVPCHRVLGAGGKVGGFSARGGVATKARLLSIEGAMTGPDPLLFQNLPITVKPGRRS